MQVIRRRRRSPRMEEFGRTTTMEVIDDKERKAKRGEDEKAEVKLRRREKADKMVDERGDKVDEREVEEEGGGGGIGDPREDW